MFTYFTEPMWDYKKLHLLGVSSYCPRHDSVRNMSVLGLKEKDLTSIGHRKLLLQDQPIGNDVVHAERNNAAVGGTVYCGNCMVTDSSVENIVYVGACHYSDRKITV